MEGNIPGFLINQWMPKLEKYCAFQERCVSDVRMKLSKLGVPQEFWSPLLERLQESGFLNEDRFTELFVRSKIRQKGWGPVKIKLELRRKNIDDDLISKYLSEFRTDDQDDLLDNWLRKKLNSVKNDEPAKQREKLIRFGISKGFESGKVFAAVNKIIKARSDD